MNKEVYENTIRIQFQMINELTEKIDEAIDYIKENIDNTGWLEIGTNDVKELLEILGDKENE